MYCGRKLCDKEVISVLRKYLSIDGIKRLNDAEAYNREIGLSLDEEITLKIKESYEKYRENFPVSLKSINNAFLWAITTNADSEMSNILQFILINRVYFTIKELRETYGDDVLEYILLHGNYNIERGINPVIESDKKILLVTSDNKLKEVEVDYTTSQKNLIDPNYSELANYLKREMRNNIEFRRYNEEVVANGKYYNHQEDSQRDISSSDDGISFYYKIRKDDFLKIEVSSNHKDKVSKKEKLAALSNFYEVLSVQYGEPSTFCILRDDKKEALDLIWYFNNKEKDMQEVERDSFFENETITLEGTDVEDIDIYIIGSKPDAFSNIIAEEMKKATGEDNLESPLYDNNMGLKKKPIQP